MNNSMPDDVQRRARKTAHFVLAGLPLGESADEGNAVLEVGTEFIAHAIMAERNPIKALLLEHESLAGPYVHDLIRAIDGSS